MADRTLHDMTREPGARVQAGLQSQRSRVIQRVRVARRRRQMTGASVALVALAAAAVAVSVLDPAQVNTPLQPDPSIGVVEPRPDAEEDMWLEAFDRCGEQYVPPAPPGVTLVADDARDLDISVASELRSFRGDRYEVSDHGFELPVTESLLTYLDVSWAGQRELAVDAYAVWVSADGIIVSAPHAHAYDRTTGLLTGAASAVGDGEFGFRTFVDGSTHVTVAIETAVSLCDRVVNLGGGPHMPNVFGYEYYSQFDGTYRLAVVVHVYDESGDLLATVVDDTEVGGLEVTFREREDLWLPNNTRVFAGDLEQVERERGIIERALGARSQPLGTSDGSAGVRILTSQCQRMDAALAGWDDVALIPVSISDAQALHVEAVPVVHTNRLELETRWDYANESSGFVWIDYMYVDATALFFAADGSFAGSAIIYERRFVTDDVQPGHMSEVARFRGGDECPALRGAPTEAGDYSVVMVVTHPGGSHDHGSLGLAMPESVAELWVNLGTVTIAER